VAESVSTGTVPAAAVRDPSLRQKPQCEPSEAVLRHCRGHARVDHSVYLDEVDLVISQIDFDDATDELAGPAAVMQSPSGLVQQDAFTHGLGADREVVSPLAAQ
jgi:hypothetical protein